ncbi:MAG: DUF370 domain-containing protein [Clostridia bacterium]|jgi:hypothetical protein|nr:DUF370 domain-containing protein [Clostridia bacterium]
MYLHIGKDIILKKEEIIGIFNIESIAETKEYKIIIDKLKEERKIQDISKEDQKTLILYKKNDNLYGIISNISSNSIGKRNKND